MPSVNVINQNLHNLIVRNDIPLAKKLAKLDELLKMGADPYIPIYFDVPGSDKKITTVPAFLSALRRENELIVAAILKFGKPKDLSTEYPHLEDGLPKEFEAHRANWCHMASLNTSTDCLLLLKEHQNANFPHHSFKSAINKKFCHRFPNGRWQLTTLASVLLRRISMLDVKFSAYELYGDAEEFEGFLAEWLFCSPKETRKVTISSDTTIVFKGASGVLKFLLECGLSKHLTDHEGYTLEGLAEILADAFSDVVKFAEHEAKLIYDNITRTCDAVIFDNAIAFKVKAKNAYGVHDVDLQIAVQQDELMHVVKHTVETASDAVQHLETAVAEVKADVAEVKVDLAEVKRHLAKLEAEVAEGNKQQYKAALNTFPRGSQYRVGFQALHTRIHGLIQQTLESPAGVYATEMSEDTKMGLSFVSLLSIGGIGGQVVNPAAGIISVIQVLGKLGFMCHEIVREKRIVGGVESAVYTAEAEAHVLATAIASGLMNMAQNVYGPDITEAEEKALVNKLFSRIEGQVKSLSGKKFTSQDALSCHLAQTAAAHLKAEYTKLHAGATVVAFAPRDKKGSGGSGKSHSSDSTPVKGSNHSSDGEHSPKTLKTPVKVEVVAPKKGFFARKLGFGG